VGAWLDYIHLSEHRAEFTKQSVSGSELVELDVDDLLELHVTKMGHRKKLVSHIKMLKHGLDGAYATNTDDGSSEGSTSGFTRTGGSSACGSASSSGGKSSASTKGDSSGKINFKCYVGDDISVLHLSANVSYSQLKSKLRKEYGAKMIVQYKDLDGDKIRIKKTSHLKAAIDECKGSGVIKLYLRERKKKVSVREQSILDTMLDAVVTINTAGRVCFFNTGTHSRGVSLYHLLDSRLLSLPQLPRNSSVTRAVRWSSKTCACSCPTRWPNITVSCLPRPLQAIRR